MREAKTAAARQGKPLTSIVCEALARSLGVEGDAQDRDDELQGDILWYRQNQPKLVRLYRDEYVAIVDAALSITLQRRLRTDPIRAGSGIFNARQN